MDCCEEIIIIQVNEAPPLERFCRASNRYEHSSADEHHAAEQNRQGAAPWERQFCPLFSPQGRMQADVKHHADDRSNQQPEPTGPRHFTGEALPDALLCDPDRPKQPDDVGPIPNRSRGDHANAEQPNAQAKGKVGLENGQNGQHKTLYQKDVVHDEGHQNAFIGQGLIQCLRNTGSDTTLPLAFARWDVDVLGIVIQHLR